MPSNETIKYVKAYMQEAPVHNGFASLTRTSREDIHNSEKIEFDVWSESGRVAPVVTDATKSCNVADWSTYSSHEVTPPDICTDDKITAQQLRHRAFGDNPYADKAGMAKVGVLVTTSMRGQQNLHMRNIELQASQLFQTGVISLLNSSGDLAYEIDYQVNPLMFPTLTTGWNNGESSYDSINTYLQNFHGIAKVPAQNAVFGGDAWDAFIKDQQMADLLDNRSVNVGSIGNGAAAQGSMRGFIPQGRIQIGSYVINLWTYPGFYELADGTIELFKDKDSVTFYADETALDIRLAFGEVIRFPSDDKKLAYPTPPSLRSINDRIALYPYNYISENGKVMTVELSSRPLVYPKSRDRFGTMTVII